MPGTPRDDLREFTRRWQVRTYEVDENGHRLVVRNGFWGTVESLSRAHRRLVGAFASAVHA
jgi:hypothetical protein